MSATWTHWDEAFLAADKEPEKRLTFTLTPALFERALVSLAVEHGWLPRDDPRYQEACRDGFLEWWDGRGRRVTLVREGGNAYRQQVAPSGARNPKFAELPDRPMPCGEKPNPDAGDAWRCPQPAGHFPATRHTDYAGAPWPEGMFEPLKDLLARGDAHKQFDVAAEKALKEAEDKAIVAELSKPPEGLVPTSGPDAVGAPVTQADAPMPPGTWDRVRETIGGAPKGKGKKK